MDERTKAVISAAIILVVNVAAMLGVNLNQDTLTNVIFGVVALAADMYGIWKNHNFTPEAATAQAFLDSLKDK